MENNSKEKNNFSKNISKRKIMFILFFIISIIILLFLSYMAFQVFKSQTCQSSILEFAQNNRDTIFSIDKVTFFTSADTKNKSSSVSNFTIENLYQYTDMAFFINNNSDENTLENTLKEVSIENISFTKTPQVGNPELYYKNINNFAKSDIVEENKIENELKFEISSEDNIDYNKPILYNNCANPIVLSYINSNIKTDYTFTDTTTPITYNGSLLKNLNIPISSLEATLLFDIFITNNLDQKFKTSVYIDIPLKSKMSEASIYDGKYTGKEEKIKYIFYRYTN